MSEIQTSYQKQFNLLGEAEKLRFILDELYYLDTMARECQVNCRNVIIGIHVPPSIT